jgi:hypothetical protein
MWIRFRRCILVELNSDVTNNFLVAAIASLESLDNCRLSLELQQAIESCRLLLDSIKKVLYEELLPEEFVQRMQALRKSTQK